MSTLAGISSYSNAASYLFSRIDTSGKGYIEKNDLVTAFSGLSANSDGGGSEVFSRLDNDSDGKITESEFSSALQTLAETLASQYDQTRIAGAMPPPPPPPAGASGDTGFSEEELSAQMEEIGDTDAPRAALISSILENFAAADSDSDGQVTHAEAMAYAEANDLAPGQTGRAAASGQVAGSDNVSDAQLYQQLMELMRAYGVQDESDSFQSALLSTLSVNA